MSPGPESPQEYRDQIARCARALALARGTEVGHDLGTGMTPDMVQLFAEGNVEKRQEKLVDQLELLHADEAFPDLSELVARYVREVPPAAYEGGCIDADAFLDWLPAHRPLTLEQRDLVVCQHGRHAVEFKARDDRPGHLRFQNLWQRAATGAHDGHSDNSGRWHLNPIRVWARLETDLLLDPEAQVPADVLFYACGSEIRTALLDPPAVRLVRALEGIAPATLDAWGGAAQADLSELQELQESLLEMGLLAPE